MYLSRLVLNPRHSRAQVDLAAPYELHRTLARAFPSDGGGYRARPGVLFRVEEAGRAGTAVLVQAATRPDWGALPDGYATRIEGPKAVALDLHVGDTLRFRLAANPVRRTNAEGKRHAVRMPLVHPRGAPVAAGGEDEGPEDGYFDWLDRQGGRHGFRVVEAADAPFRVAPRRRYGKALSKSEVPHFGVRFDGRIEVTDAERLMMAVRSGIG